MGTFVSLMPFLLHAVGFQNGDFDSGRLPNGLRLNRVKRLARSINTVSVNDASVNGHQLIEKNTSTFVVF